MNIRITFQVSFLGCHLSFICNLYTPMSFPLILSLCLTAFPPLLLIVIFAFSPQAGLVPLLFLDLGLPPEVQSLLTPPPPKSADWVKGFQRQGPQFLPPCPVICSAAIKFPSLGRIEPKSFSVGFRRKLSQVGIQVLSFSSASPNPPHPEISDSKDFLPG